MSLKLELKQGENIAEHLGVDCKRSTEIVEYLRRMVVDHVKKGLNVSETIYEVSIDPYFKNDAELTVAVFVLGEMKKYIEDRGNLLKVTKGQVREVADKNIMDFMRLIGDNDGVMNLFWEGLLSGLLQCGGERKEILDRLEKAAEKASDVVFNNAVNNGERTLVMVIMLQAMVGMMLDTANEKAKELLDLLEMMRRGNK